MEETAKIVSIILSTLSKALEENWQTLTGKDLDAMAATLIAEYGATSYNKGYKPEWAKEPYPANICISPNGIIIHGVPTDLHFQEGDIVTIDIGIKKNGLCGDGAITVGCGKLSNADERLIYYSKKAVYEYISKLRPGANTRDLANHIQSWASQMGYSVNRRGSGHTIGADMHEKPSLYNTVEDEVHTYADLSEGMVVCIEPILTKSKDTIGMVLGDSWTVATYDRKNCAMFEHMVEITKDGAKVLTTHFNNPSLKGGE